MAEQLPLEGGRGIRVAQSTPMPVNNAGIIGPSQEEAEDVNSGREQYKSLVSISGSAALKGVASVAAVTAGGAAALEVGHRINEDIPNVPAIVRSVQEFRNSIAPSGGAEFHPNAKGGEITQENSITVPLEEALSMVKTETSEHDKLFAILPESKGPLEYTVDGETIKIKGVEAGTTVVSPYDGNLYFQKYEVNGQNAGYQVNIKVKGEDGKSEEKAIGYGAHDIQLNFDPTDYTTTVLGPAGSTTTLSSDIPVKAGQPIFTLLNNEPIRESGVPQDYQLIIQWAEILSENNKAVAAPTQ